MRSRVDAIPVLQAFADHDCRFVVIGSVARQLCGADVTPADLDLVIDAARTRRSSVIAALAAVDATVDRRAGRRAIDDAIHLPWDWGWRVDTPHGSVDIITRLVDGTDVGSHDSFAHDVTIGNGLTVRCHPTEHRP